MTKNKVLAHQVTLILIALFFSILETFIPKPIPYLKLGLSNIANLIALDRFGYKFALEVLLIRIFVYSVMLGTFFTPGFFISLIAGLVTISVMYLFYKTKLFSLVAISALGGFLHNFVQIAVVYGLFLRSVTITSKGILGYMFSFMLGGAISGIIVGILASFIIAGGKIEWQENTSEQTE